MDLTAPFFKPGDAEADITATILGGGRSSRLYKSLVYDKQIAQDVSAYQQSTQLQSIFQIDATARPGHTAEELEAAIDSEIAKLVAAPPDVSEVERARNTFETSTRQRPREHLGSRPSAEHLQPLSEDAGLHPAGLRPLRDCHSSRRAGVGA